MSKPKPMVTIGEVARQYGLTLRLLRFYEERGLLSPPRFGETRVFDEGELLKLAEILRWRKQGFTVSEMKAALRDGGFSQEKIISQIEHLRLQRDEIDLAIAELEQAAQ